MRRAKRWRGVAEVVASDAGSSADIQALAKSFEARGAGVDVLFLNAGVAKFGPITSLDESAFDEIFRVNVRGPLADHQALCSAAAPRRVDRLQ